MSKEITCDICKKRMGIKVRINTVYGSEPTYDNFYAVTREFDDICCNCEQELRDAVHAVIKKIEVKE